MRRNQRVLFHLHYAEEQRGRTEVSSVVMQQIKIEEEEIPALK